MPGATNSKTVDYLDAEIKKHLSDPSSRGQAGAPGKAANDTDSEEALKKRFEEKEARI